MNEKTLFFSGHLTLINLKATQNEAFIIDLSSTVICCMRKIEFSRVDFYKSIGYYSLSFIFKCKILLSTAS